MKTFLKVIAWIGAGFMLLPMLYLFICWLVRISQPPPYPPGGVAFVFFIIIPLVILGFLLILVGGLIGKPKYFWLASLVLGILYIGTFSQFILNDLRKILFGQPINIHIDDILFITFCVVPGLVAIVEGILLRTMERKIQRRTGPCE